MFLRKSRHKDHIAKDLRTPKYKPRVVPDKRKKPERYPILDDVFLMHEYNPLDKDKDDI